MDDPCALEKLVAAHAAARLPISLDEALKSPLVARCLEITAGVLASTSEHRSPPESHRRSTTLIDFKRRASGDDF